MKLTHLNEWGWGNNLHNFVSSFFVNPIGELSCILLFKTFSFFMNWDREIIWTLFWICYIFIKPHTMSMSGDVLKVDPPTYCTSNFGLEHEISCQLRVVKWF